MKLNKQLSQHLTPLVNQANQTSSQKSNLLPQVQKSESILQNAYEFCEVMNATSQGLAFLAKQALMEQNREAALLGAVQATLLIQGRLAKDGHSEAAEYITELFSQLNFGGILPLSFGSTSIPPISEEKSLYFSGASKPPRHTASNEAASSNSSISIEEVDEDEVNSKGKEKASLK
jgi:hypothetical protein